MIRRYLMSPRKFTLVTAMIAASLALSANVLADKPVPPGQPFQALAEIVTQVQSSVDDLSVDVNANGIAIDTIQESIDDPDTGLVEIKAEVKAIEERLDDPDTGLVEIKAEVKAIEDKLNTFDQKLTSGLFLISPQAVSVDWAMLNQSDEDQTIKVTVYQYPIGLPRIQVDQLTWTISPGTAIHNANSVGTVYTKGFYTEVVVERKSPNVFPSVTQWSSMGGDFIPGTLIPSGDFVGIKP